MVTKKKTKFFKSLRFRILIILIILGIVPSAIVTQLMISNYEKQAIEVKVSEVSTQCAILCNQIIKENYLNDSSSQSVNSKLELLSNVYGGRMVLVDRDLKVVADTYHVDEGRTLISPKVVKCFKNGEVTNYRRYGQMLEMAVPVKSADVPQIQGAMLVNISISDIMATVGAQEQMAMLIIGIIVALSALLAYGLSTILVKPLASVTKSIEDLTDGYQKDEISVPDYTETELITDAFNKMLARMKVLDESRSEFVSNVSHELKTPMTSMKVLADSLVGQEGVPEELYQEFMRDITAEIDRENRIITDLLTLVKMDKKSADLQISHMDINQLLEDILKRLRPIADKRNIDLILDSFRQMTVAKRFRSFPKFTAVIKYSKDSRSASAHHCLKRTVRFHKIFNLLNNRILTDDSRFKNILHFRSKTVKILILNVTDHSINIRVRLNLIQMKIFIGKFCGNIDSRFTNQHIAFRQSRKSGQLLSNSFCKCSSTHNTIRNIRTNLYCPLHQFLFT